jgi:hypothetical protein
MAVSVETTVFCDVTRVVWRMSANVSCSQLRIQWVSGALFLWVKHPGREVNHFLESRTEIKNAWSCKYIPQCDFMMWCLIKYRSKFTFTFYWVSFFWDKRQAHEADLSHPPSSKLKNAWSYTPHSPIPLHEAW